MVDGILWQSIAKSSVIQIKIRKTDEEYQKIIVLWKGTVGIEHTKTQTILVFKVKGHLNGDFTHELLIYH